MLLNPHGSVVDEVSAVLAIAQHTTVAQPAVDGPRVSSLDLLSEVVTVENSSSEEISLDGWTVQSTTGARSQRLPPGNTPNAPLRASCVVYLGFSRSSPRDVCMHVSFAVSFMLADRSTELCVSKRVLCCCGRFSLDSIGTVDPRGAGG